MKRTSATYEEWATEAIDEASNSLTRSSQTFYLMNAQTYAQLAVAAAIKESHECQV